MNKMLKTFLREFTFRRQLAITISLGILFLALFSSLVSSWQANERVRRSLIGQGQRITENLVHQSSLALLTASPDNAASAVSATLSFPGVIGVEIRDASQKILLTRGDTRSTEFLKDFVPVAEAEALSVLDAESEGAWRFSAPVYSQPPTESPFQVQDARRERLGDIVVVVSKATLSQMTRDIFIVNMTSTFFFALLVLALIRALTNRMTRPLNQLSDSMARAEAGESTVRAMLSGPKDIAHMAQAFNSMMVALETRAADILQTKIALEEAQRMAHIGDIVLADPATILRCSDEATRILCCTQTDSAQDIFSCFRPVDRDALCAILHKAMLNPLRQVFDFNVGIHRSHKDLRLVIARHDSWNNILITVQDVTEIRRSERALRALVEKTDSLREIERAHIAHELHDELGQVLTAIRMHASLLTQEDSKLIFHLTDRAIEYVRNMASTMRPAALDLGLARGIEWLGQELKSNHGIECAMSLDPVDMPEQKAIQIFRIVQECLTNTAKHSQADRAEVDMVVDGDSLVLRIQDNGVGFDPKQSKANAMGLIGIQERVLRLRGIYKLIAACGQGTKHYIEIPLEDRRKCPHLS